MSNINKKLLGTGAVVVALSAFVPNPFIIDNPLFVGDALAQPTDKDTMNLTAKVVNPLNVSQITKLNFGSFAVGALAGKLTVTDAGAAAISNGVLLGGHAAGKVSFTAPQNAVFIIELQDLAATSIVLKNGAGATSKLTMKVDQITVKGTAKINIGGMASGAATFAKAGNTDTTAKITDAGGKAALNVGARLLHKPNQTVGSYTGTYFFTATF